ncbi:MAG: hypothetical protein ACQRW7_02370 [Caulobacterales bacterium]|uniref:hypothetical protein n=1 Tax=Glycocaulis sp. TaxID=1969725 RepID=UPI003FA07FBE
MIVWPETLPQYPQREGLDSAGGENVQRSPVDAGPPKRRRVSTRMPDRLRATWYLTPAQYAIWQDFLEDDIAQGALRFTLPDPFSDGTLNAALVNGKASVSVNPGPGVMISLGLDLEVL